MQPCIMDSSPTCSSASLAPSLLTATSSPSAATTTTMTTSADQIHSRHSDSASQLEPIERSSSSLSSISSASTASATMDQDDQRELAARRSEAPSPTPSTLSTLSLSGLLERSEAEQQLGTAVAPDHVPESSALRRIRIFTGSSTVSSASSSSNSSLDRSQQQQQSHSPSGVSQGQSVPSNASIDHQSDSFCLSPLVGGSNRRRRSSAAYFVAVGGGMGGAQDDSPPSSLLFGPGGSVVSNVVRGIHSFSVTSVPCSSPTTTTTTTTTPHQQLSLPPLPLSPASPIPSPSSAYGSSATVMDPTTTATRYQQPDVCLPGATLPQSCTSAVGTGLVVRSPRESMFTADPLGLPPSAAQVTAIPPTSPTSSKYPVSPAATTELAVPPPPAASAAPFHQHFPRRPRPSSTSVLGRAVASRSPPPTVQETLSIDTPQDEQPPRKVDVAVPQAHSPHLAPQASAASHSPNELALHPMQRALIERLASASEEASSPRAPTLSAVAPSSAPGPPLSPGTSTQQSAAAAPPTMGVGAMPAFRAIVTTDVRGTVRTANDRFSALVAHLIPRTASAPVPQHTTAASPAHSPSSSASSSSTSPTLGHSTSPSPASLAKKPQARKGFVVFDLDTHPEPTRAGNSSGSTGGSPAGGATPEGSPASGRRTLLFGTAGAPASPVKSGASMIGTNVLDLIVSGHRDKIAKKVGKKVEAAKRRGAGQAVGSGGEVDEVLVAGRIVRLQRASHGRSVPVSLWIKARFPSPTSIPITSLSSSSSSPPTHTPLDPVLLWVIEEIHEVALHCTVSIDPQAGPGLPMVSQSGPWCNVFPSLACAPPTATDGPAGPLCKLAQVIPALAAPNALDLIDSIRFFSACDVSATGTSAFPVLIHRDHPHRVQSAPSSRSPSPLATAHADPNLVSLTLLVLPHIAGMITVDDRATICAIHPGLAKQLVGKAAKYLVGEPLGNVFPLLPNVIRRLAARSTAAPPPPCAGPDAEANGGEGGSASSMSLDSNSTASTASLNVASGGAVVDEPPASVAALARMGAVADGPVVSAATIRRLATSMAAAAAAAEAVGEASGTHKHHHHRHHAPSPTMDANTSASAGGPKPGVYCVHRDGGRITCDVQVRPLATLAGRVVFSLWVTFDHAMHRWALPAAAAAAAPSSAAATSTSPVALAPVASQSQPPPLGQKLVGKSAADYDVIHRMGEGAYGQVQLVRDRASGSMLALKLIDKDKIVPDAWTKRKPYGVIPREIAILADLYDDAGLGNGYPRSIVKMVGFWEGAREFGLEMQVHGEGMDLFEYIERMKGMSEEVARRIFFQVCNAVAYLHARKICHRDIKDENVILDHELNAQLIDFGSAAYVRSEKATFDTFAGTLEYCSPEVILGKRYQGKPQDIWALGILMYVMLFRECPFFTDDEVLLRSVQVPKGATVSPEAVALLRAVLNKDLAKRPTIEQVVAHAWFDAVREVVGVAAQINET